MLAVLTLAGGWTGSVVVPIGPPGGLHWTCDALSAVFLLIVCIAGAAAALECSTPLLPVAVGGMMLTLLAADGFTLVLCLGLASVAAWGSDPETRPGLEQAACSILCLIAAMALLAPPDAALDLRFAAMRATAPEGARAATVLLLTVLGTGSRLAWPAWSGPAGALLSGGMAMVAIYVLIRVLLDLCGPAVPGWWALPLLVFGAGATVWGGLRSSAEDDLLAILAASRLGAAGLITVGLGIALKARDADVPSLGALALAGALLHAVSYALFDTLLVLCTAAVARGAGTRALSRLGGLIRSMPGVTLSALAGAACLAGLPLTAGFAGRWLLVQSLLAIPQVGGLWQQVGFAVVLAAVALGAALTAAGAVRLIGIGFLGRPRTPRAAAAEDAPLRFRMAAAGLAGLCVLVGVWPSLVLALVRPTLTRLLGVGLEDRLLVIPAQAAGPGYAAPGIAAMLALSGGAVAWVAWRLAGRSGRRVPAWDGGLDEPPPWLPFGDPATQYSAASAGQPLLQSLDYPNWLRPIRLRSLHARVKATIGRQQHPGAGGLAGALLLALVGLLLLGLLLPASR